MDFIHTPFEPGATIAAVATPPGEGGIAVIRISGKQALSVANKIFSGPVNKYQTHTAHFGKFLSPEGEVLDEGLALVMLGTRSYTGEDTVELSCHGGSLVTKRVLEAVLASGARAAGPGEFTLKAFMNGKIDLAQAEAVQELIAAKNDKALDAAENVLEGRLSREILSFQKEFTHMAAILEAWVDFPDEDLEFTTFQAFEKDLQTQLDKMQRLADSFDDGRILHDGLSLAIVGCPNVGKSSLMNALLEKERAIVTDIPGTTRDILEDQVKLNGLNILLKDTAGIREGAEVIEQEGIRRSYNALKEADLVLFVLDASKGLQEKDKELMEAIPQDKSIVVWNKMDVAIQELPTLDYPHIIHLSAKERQNLQELKEEIDCVIWKEGPPSKSELVITNARHHQALEEAILYGNNVIQGLKGQYSPEFLAQDMRYCLQELGKVIGTNITEDVLTDIFSTFCIGK